jgi:hypothetical protein
MFKRFFFLTVMMGAAGVPYVLSTSAEWWAAAKSRFASRAQPAGAPVPDAASGSFAAPAHGGQASTFGSPTFATTPTKLPIEGAGTYDLAEIFNFNATPAWVIARWPRVTAGLSDPELEGYRVPLITGTAEDDLAGSLTYYFDTDGRVKLIHFRGATGNPRKIVGLVTSHYQFKQQPTDDPSLALYQIKWNGKPTSELRVRTARILRADQPHGRYQIELAMKRP